MTTPIEEKIAKLLVKAERTTPEEAEALTEHAERLMLKYGIDQAVINARRSAGGQSTEKIVKKYIVLTGIYRQALIDLGYNVVTAFGSTQAYYTNLPQNKIRLTIVGHESDVRQVMLLVTSLNLQVATAVTTWWMTYDGRSSMTGMEKFKARRQFIKSFGWTVADRISARRRTAETEAQSTEPGTEIVLRDRRTAVDQFMESIKLKTTRDRSHHGGYDAANAGNAAGRRANTGESSIGRNGRELDR